MARASSGKYMGETPKCRVKWEPCGDNVERWCVYHGTWYLDCVECGEWFHTVRSHTKYCSTACSQKAFRYRVKRELGL